MLQAMKVFILRKYYRFVSARAWRGHLPGSRPGQALEIPTPAGSVPARLYEGAHQSELPLILYFHGGGWVIGDLNTHDPFCRALCETTGCSVLSVDYRLAPEHPFPAAQDDALAAAHWAAAQRGQPGAPGNGYLILAGDSAGAQLSCCTCLEADPETRAVLAGAIAIYPAVDHYSALPASYIERASGQLLTSKMMVWFWDTYLGELNADDAAAQRALPLRSDTPEAMPPTFLVTAEYDPLRDEGKAFADRLRDAGVDLYYRHYPEAAHGFACSEGPTPAFKAMMSELTGWVRAHQQPGE